MSGMHSRRTRFAKVKIDPKVYLFYKLERPKRWTFAMQGVWIMKEGIRIWPK
jgi:hypothetical protein